MTSPGAHLLRVGGVELGRGDPKVRSDANRLCICDPNVAVANATLEGETGCGRMTMVVPGSEAIARRGGTSSRAREKSERLWPLIQPPQPLRT